MKSNCFPSHFLGWARSSSVGFYAQIETEIKTYHQFNSILLKNVNKTERFGLHQFQFSLTGYKPYVHTCMWRSNIACEIKVLFSFPKSVKVLYLYLVLQIKQFSVRDGSHPFHERRKLLQAKTKLKTERIIFFSLLRTWFFSNCSLRKNRKNVLHYIFSWLPQLVCITLYIKVPIAWV